MFKLPVAQSGANGLGNNNSSSYCQPTGLSLRQAKQKPPRSDGCSNKRRQSVVGVSNMVCE